jgi:hypothetical protein
LKKDDRSNKVIAELLKKYETRKAPERIDLEKIEQEIECGNYEEFYDEIASYEKLDRFQKHKKAQWIFLKLDRTPTYKELLSEMDRNYLREYRIHLAMRLKYCPEVDAKELRNHYITLLKIERLLDFFHPNPLVEDLIGKVYDSIVQEDYSNTEILMNEVKNLI